MDDCRTRAKASGGQYAPAYQVCLVDQHKLDAKLAERLGDAEDWRGRVGYDVTREGRWSTFGVYASYLRLARFSGVDSNWIEETLRRDSVSWVKTDSIMGTPAR